MTALKSSMEGGKELEEATEEPEVDSDLAAMQPWYMPLQKDHGESGSVSYRTVNNLDRPIPDRTEKSWNLSSLSSQQDFDEDVESVASLQGGQLDRYRMDSSPPIIQHLNPIQPDSNVVSEKSIRKRRQNEAVAVRSEKKTLTVEPKDRKSSIFKFKRKTSKKKKGINDEFDTNSNVSATSSDNDGKLSTNKSPKRNKLKHQSSLLKKAESKSIKDDRKSFDVGNSDNVHTTSSWFRHWQTKSKRKHKSPSTPRRSALKNSIAEADTLEYRRSNDDQETSSAKADNVTQPSLQRRQQRNDDDHFRQEDLPAASVTSAESQERGVTLSTPPSPPLRVSGRSVEFADDVNYKHAASKSERQSSTSGKSSSGSSGSRQTSENDQSSMTTDSESNSGSTSGKTSVDEGDYSQWKDEPAEKLKQLRRNRRPSRHVRSGTWRRRQSQSDESGTESSVSGAGSSSTASAVSQIVIEENDEHSTYKPLFGGIHPDTASVRRVGQSGTDDSVLPPSKIFYA